MCIQANNKGQDTAGVKEITSSEQEGEGVQMVSKEDRGLSEVESSNSRTQVARKQVSIDKMQVENSAVKVPYTKRRKFASEKAKQFTRQIFIKAGKEREREREVA